MGTERQAYQAFRNRLDAVLRQRDPEALRAFLIAEGQWQPDTTTNTEAAMWMMVATSPALSALHDEAQRWLLTNGHEAEASAIFGGREQGGAPGGARRGGPHRSGPNRSGRPSNAGTRRPQGGANGYPSQGYSPHNRDERPRRDWADQTDRDARPRRGDAPRPSQPPRERPAPRPAHAPAFPAPTHPDAPLRRTNPARPPRSPLRPPHETSAPRPNAPHRERPPRERPE